MESQTPTITPTNVEQSSSNKFNHKTLIIAGLVVGALLTALFYYKGLFIAATVNGTSVSRLAVVTKAEKQIGKTVLDTIITEHLISSEAKKQGIVISEDEINEEIKQIETSLSEQGQSLEVAIEQQNMTMEELRENIKTQKILEAALNDKLQVTDEEIDTFISDNGITLDEVGQSEIKEQIAGQIRNQKLGMEAQAWIDSLKASANIKYHIDY